MELESSLPHSQKPTNDPHYDLQNPVHTTTP